MKRIKKKTTVITAAIMAIMFASGCNNSSSQDVNVGTKEQILEKETSSTQNIFTTEETDLKTSKFMTDLKSGIIKSKTIDDIVADIKAEGIPYYDLSEDAVNNYDKNGLIAFGINIEADLEDFNGYHIMTVLMDDGTYTMAIGKDTNITLEEAKKYATKGNSVYYVAYVKEVGGKKMLFPIIARYDNAGFYPVNANIDILYKG